jgi:hypothetical protein
MPAYPPGTPVLVIGTGPYTGSTGIIAAQQPTLLTCGPLYLVSRLVPTQPWRRIAFTARELVEYPNPPEEPAPCPS